MIGAFMPEYLATGRPVSTTVGTSAGECTAGVNVGAVETGTGIDTVETRMEVGFTGACGGGGAVTVTGEMIGVCSGLMATTTELGAGPTTTEGIG